MWVLAVVLRVRPRVRRARSTELRPSMCLDLLGEPGSSFVRVTIGEWSRDGAIVRRSATSRASISLEPDRCHLRPTCMRAMRSAAGAVTLLLAAACGPSATAHPAGAGGSPRSTEASGRAPAATGCPSPHPLSTGKAASVDYVDFVFHAGVSYLNASQQSDGAPPLAPADVGGRAFRVSCEFSAFTASGRVEPPAMTEGASGSLPAGTDVHAVRGFPTGCRVTAQRDGRWVVYLAQHEENHVSTPVPCALRPTRSAL